MYPIRVENNSKDIFETAQKESVAPLITVIVITRNRAGILGDCLQSILSQDFSKDQYELVVVDDGSTDRTSAVIRSLQSSSDSAIVRYVSQSHQGVNAARNAGIENARGEIVLFLDDDELAPSDHLTRVRHLLSQDPNLAGVGGPVRDRGGSKLPTCPECSLADADVPGVGKRIVPRLLGGNMALRASVFRQVGLFEEELSGRGDDNEWFHRASGLKFLHDPDLWVWHRRDNFNLVTICRHSFVQGLSSPLAEQKIGRHYRPKPMRIVRSLAHALRRGCAWGVVLACREIGSVLGYLKLRTVG